MNKIRINKAGPFTTIQDKGRWGYQQFGMSVAGVMDQFATRVANLLVGNDEYKSVLETTLLGPEIQFECDEVIAITGANMSPTINGEAIDMWTSVPVKKGDILSFSYATSGFRGYIAFSRGLDIPTLMDSQSTFHRGKIGGLHGEKLKNGDEIFLGDVNLSTTGSYLPHKWIPTYENQAAIRVVMGPQDDYFTREAIDRFLSADFKITSEADRMGYRLDGPKIDHKKGADIVSDGSAFGSIQVPGHGSPIILLADRGTTGGYTKIATVITPDLSVLAQMGPGSSLNFKKIDVYQSHEVYKEYEDHLKEIKTFIKNHFFDFYKEGLFNLNIDGTSYKINIKEVHSF